MPELSTNSLKFRCEQSVKGMLTDLRVSCILAKTYTTELHPTAIESFFIPHLASILREEEVFSSQQPLEKGPHHAFFS